MNARAWRRPWGLLLALALAAASTTVHAQSDEEQARDRLNALKREIADINRSLQADRGRRDTLQNQLRDAEKELGQVQRSIRETENQLAEGERELAVLDQRREALRQARDEQQARISAEMRMAWQLGQQGQVKVLLNQEDPQTVARTLDYYRYFFDARKTLIDGYRDTLTELAEVQSDILDTNERLDRQRAELAQRQDRLELAKKNRELAVAALSARIEDQDTRLKAMEADRKELERLLATIERAIDKLEVPDNYQDFAAAKGKMPWPVPGKPSNRFGRSRNEGKMRWQGVNIPAREGDTVRAIHHGRVVYADWFRGSGLLMIIDHGNGYMSLYAHNQSLLMDVGEWVTAGTPISTVGSSGGQDRAALYFEIRHQGKPTDPSRWCRG